MALELKHIIETNLVRISHHCISHSYHFNSHLKRLYISNKTERFSYKGGLVCVGIHISSVEKKSWLEL